MQQLQSHGTEHSRHSSLVWIPQGALSWLGRVLGKTHQLWAGRWGRSLGLNSLGNRNMSQWGGKGGFVL